MAKRTYSIRRGFHYQDLFCAIEILRHYPPSSPLLRFSIEYSEAVSVDDLVFLIDEKVIEAFQVKFHVTQGHNDTFESFTNRKSAQSKSLLKKLYQSWVKLSSDGAHPIPPHLCLIQPRFKRS